MTKKLVLSMVALSLPGFAVAGEPNMNNTYVQGGYSQMKFDDDFKPKGLGIEGSFEVAPQLAVNASIGQLKGKEDGYDYTLDRLGFGLAYLIGLDAVGIPMDLNLHAGIKQWKVTASSDSESDRSSKLTIKVIGAEGRAQFTPIIEGFADVSIWRDSNDTEPKFTLGTRIGQSDGVQGVISYGKLDKTNDLKVGVRYNF